MEHALDLTDPRRTWVEQRGPYELHVAVCSCGAAIESIDGGAGVARGFLAHSEAEAPSDGARQ